MTAHKGRAVDSLWSPGICRERDYLGTEGLSDICSYVRPSLALRTQVREWAWFLLTSACAVMLELITVHGLFAVSSFPADTEKRDFLSRVISRPHAWT